MKDKFIKNTRHRNAMGMTLVEIMVVISIGVLLITALLFYVFPSDDRRCRLEAERLAAYLTAASAEALMRDGSARVVFDFRDRVANRQVLRAGADITREMWDADAKAAEHEVKHPVELLSVNTPSVPDLTAGTGYINFQGEKTDGAAVVLGLEEALYTVLVPPRGGEIRVEKGRVGIPGGSGEFQRPRMPDLLGYTDAPRKTSGIASAANLPRSLPQRNRRPSTSSGKASSKRKSSGSSKSPSKRSSTKYDGPTSDHDYQPSPSSLNAPDLDPNTGFDPQPDSTDTPNPGPTDPKDPPTQQRDCRPPPAGTGEPCPAWRTCMGNGQCSPNVMWSGRSVRLSTIRVEKPQALSSVLDAMLGNLIDEGQLNLAFKLNQSGHLVRGDYVPGGVGIALYEQSESFPSYSLSRRSQTIQGQEIPLGNIGCSVQTSICNFQYDVDGEDHAMMLYVNDVNAEENACQYQTIELINVEIDITIGIAQAFPTIQPIRISGTIRRSSARNYQVTDQQSLADYLEDSGVQPDADSNEDGTDDSWKFEFSGAGAEIAILGNPSARTEVTPRNCD